MKYDYKFLIFVTIPLILVIIFTTILHHFYPGVLQVPNVQGPYLMDNILLDLIIMDVGTLIISSLVMYHSIRTQKDGLFKTVCFVNGSIVFTGLEESYWILTGRFGLVPFGTYFFTKGGLWFLEIPVYTCLGWFVLAWCCMYMAKKILPNQNLVVQAIIAGFMAVSLDFFIDPVMVNLGSASIYPDSKGMWVWLTEKEVSFSIFSIPFFNFFGWFLVIALFAIIYELVITDEKIEVRGKSKSALLFFGLIPVFLGICIGLIFIMSMIMNPLLAGIDIIPIGIT